MAARFVHHLADFVDVPAKQLRDRDLLGGLLIAAASAVGMNAKGLPMTVVQPAGELSATLLDDHGHITLHSHPARGLLLLDVLASVPLDGSRAVDVFTRRLTARDVRRGTHERG